MLKDLWETVYSNYTIAPIEVPPILDQIPLELGKMTFSDPSKNLGRLWLAYTELQGDFTW